MKSSKPKFSEGRRRFLRDTARTAAGVGVAATVLGLQSMQSKARDTTGLPVRPPGALEGEAFESACVRCGLCVQACPYDTLKLAWFTLRCLLSSMSANRQSDHIRTRS